MRISQADPSATGKARMVANLWIEPSGEITVTPSALARVRAVTLGFARFESVESRLLRGGLAAALRQRRNAVA